MVVTVVTGNPGKAEFFRGCLAAAGLRSASLLRTLDELQASSIEAVARNKAQQAITHAAPPLLVEDAGLVIESLGGFPGPMTRYTLETAGSEGLVKIAAAAACAVESVTVVTDQLLRQHLFVDRVEGTLVTAPREIAPGAQDDLWRIFVPRGEHRPFSTLTCERQLHYISQRRERFSAWLKNLLRTAPAAI